MALSVDLAIQQFLDHLRVERELSVATLAAYGHDLMTELRVLLLHGVLHLLGHDHSSDAGKMRRMEVRWRREFGLPAGVIERATKQKGARQRSARHPTAGGGQR